MADQASTEEVMVLDIGPILRQWKFRPGEVTARKIRAGDGREVLQLRIELGVLQMEVEGRPDGRRPHGCRTYFDFLKQQARKRGSEFVMSDEQCHKADREFLQFYHRRICWLALKEYDRAVADADHNLAFMDFIKQHSPSEEYTLAHEQYRGFVLFHRTQAAVGMALEEERPEDAIDHIRDALSQLADLYEEFEQIEHMEDDEMVRQLRELEQYVRRQYGVIATLREQLDRAVANEQYELAARLRDRLRSRTQSS